jgi:hypothetical protein
MTPLTIFFIRERDGMAVEPMVSNIMFFFEK